MASILPSPPLPATPPRRLRCSRFLSQPSLLKRRMRCSVVRLSPLHEVFFLLDVSTPASEIAVAGLGEAAYSPASYYTSLGLFVISVPGLWSLIKRSVKSKIVQKNFVKEGATRPNQVAGEILSFFTRNNFTVSDRGETITYFSVPPHDFYTFLKLLMANKNNACNVFDERFEGVMAPSRGQAALLTFCTCISLASVGLVLSIAIPEGGNNWFWLMSLSPLAGVYYWQRASRKEEIKVKILVGNDANLSEIIVRGDDQQVEQMRKELKLSEKGMVYVKGIFEQ